MKIGENLKRWRAFRNVTQKELAEAIGITQAALSLYERGQRKIDAEALEKISLLLDVPIGLFFEDAPEQKRLERTLATQ